MISLIRLWSEVVTGNRSVFVTTLNLTMAGPAVGDAISWLDVAARTNINRRDAAETTAYKRPGHIPWYTSTVQLEVNQY